MIKKNPFEVYIASAGSGKTYTLARTYVGLALNGNTTAYRQILAVTFTNKAAKEMRQRVLYFLHLLSQGQAGDLQGQLEAETGLPAEVIRQRAQSVHRHMLHHYSDIAIGTLDSFTSRIIRSFAREFGIQADAEVILDESEALFRASDSLLQNIQSHPEFARVLNEQIQEDLYRDTAPNINMAIEKSINSLQQYDAPPAIDALSQLPTDEILKAYRSVIDEAKKARNLVNNRAQEFLNYASAHNLNEKDFSYGMKGVYGAMVRITQGENFVSKRLSDVVQKGEGLFSAKNRAKHQHHTESLLQLLDRVKNEAEQHAEILDLENFISKSFSSLLLYKYLIDAYKNYLTRENKVPLSQFNLKLAQVILNEPAPFVYEKIGTHYKHFLIDEFQDTSILQWNNFVPLLEEGLSARKYSMVVGDAKQAIYSWRGGDMRQLIELPKLPFFPDEMRRNELENVLSQTFSERVLDINYRSRKNIVNFNNSFYTALRGHLHYGSQVYNKIEQKPLDKRAGGYITTQKLAQEEIEQSLFDKIKEVRSRGFSLGEICILVRTNREASAFANFLLKQGIAVMGPVVLDLGKSETVRVLVAALRQRLGVARCADRETLARWAFRNEENYNSMLQKCTTVLHDGQRDIDLSNVWKLSDASILGLWDQRDIPHITWIQNIAVALGCWQSEPLFVSALLDSLQKELTNLPDLTSSLFEEYLQPGKKTISSNGQAHAINLYTIHKAKGLEFPVVLIPSFSFHVKADAHWYKLTRTPIPFVYGAYKQAELWFNDLPENELQRQKNAHALINEVEQANTLYVATTRAVDELHLWLVEKKQNKAAVALISECLKQVTDFIGESFSFVMGEPVYKKSELHNSESVETKTPDNILHSNAATWLPADLKPKVAPVQAAFSTENTETSRQLKGIWMHTLLAEKEPLLVQMRAKSTEVDEMRELAQRIRMHPDLQIFFDSANHVYSEHTLLLPGDAVNQRPDRVVLRDEGAYLLDFKFGLPRDEHISQVRAYQVTLEAMGYRVKRATLVYADEEHLRLHEIL